MAATKGKGSQEEKAPCIGALVSDPRAVAFETALVLPWKKQAIQLGPFFFFIVSNLGQGQRCLVCSYYSFVPPRSACTFEMTKFTSPTSSQKTQSVLVGWQCSRPAVWRETAWPTSSRVANSNAPWSPTSLPSFLASWLHHSIRIKSKLWIPLIGTHPPASAFGSRLIQLESLR